MDVLELKIVGDERDAIEDIIEMDGFFDALTIETEDDALVISIDEDMMPDLASVIELHADHLSNDKRKLAKKMSKKVSQYGANPLGPSLTYDNPSVRKKKERFPDGTGFDFDSCDHGSDPDNKEVDLIIRNQGPTVVPWARFAATFNIQSDPPQALAFLGEEEEDTPEVLRPEFGAWAKPEPMVIAANRGDKVVPLPMTTPSRLRVETLDEKLQGWAYPDPDAGKGKYIVHWSDGSHSNVDRKDVHWVRSTIRMKDVMQEHLWAKDPFSAAELGIKPQNLLRENDKLIKGREKGYYSLGLMLSPWSVAGIGNLCPYASKGCAEGCLNMSGQGELAEYGVQVGADIEDISWVQEFRKRSTYLFQKNRDEFKEILYAAIERAIEGVNSKTKPRGGVNPVYGMNLCIRLNTLSDVPWVAIKYKGKSFIDHFSRGKRKIQFYDYTKDIKRMELFLAGKLPKNYHLTFSWSESDAPYAFDVLHRGGSVAVAFDTIPLKTVKGKAYVSYLPKWWNGFKVIDADISDIRYMDAEFFTNKDLVSDRWTEQDRQDLIKELNAGRGFVCGLRLKGNKARKTHRELKSTECRAGDVPTSGSGGFVQYADDAGMRPDGDAQGFSEQCDPGNGRMCEIKKSPKARDDQQYVSTCNLTNGNIHPDPFGYGMDYLGMLADLGAHVAKEQAKEGFIANYRQLQSLGMAE